MLTYVHACMHAHMYSYRSTYILILLYPQAHMHKHAWSDICIHEYTCTHPTCAYMPMYMHIHIYISSWTCVHIYTCMYTCILINTYMYVPYAYTCATCMETYLCACTYADMHISSHTHMSLSAAPTWNVLPYPPGFTLSCRKSCKWDGMRRCPMSHSTEDVAG